ncbi:alpha/beta fold hydrolase, partial [Streptomyces sp. G1]|uniref:alpha/beta fold hydrolase n=1 Tax=Streptomyces sp. G1 TaxID=361572 RepID=UPI0035AB7F92|nr:hypothetical protein [Streptomyces sp. G1]
MVDGTRPPLPADYVDRVEAALARGSSTEALTHFVTTGLALPDEDIAGMRNTPVWAAWEAAARTGQPLPTGRWSSVSVPVLVAHGGAGDAYMAHAAKELASHGDNYTLHTLPGQAGTDRPRGRAVGAAGRPPPPPTADRSGLYGPPGAARGGRRVRAEVH